MLKFSVILEFDLMKTKVVIFYISRVVLSWSTTWKLIVKIQDENILVTACSLEGKYAKQLRAQSHWYLMQIAQALTLA